MFFRIQQYLYRPTLLYYSFSSILTRKLKLEDLSKIDSSFLRKFYNPPICCSTSLLKLTLPYESNLIWLKICINKIISKLKNINLVIYELENFGFEERDHTSYLNCTLFPQGIKIHWIKHLRMINIEPHEAYKKNIKVDTIILSKFESFLNITNKHFMLKFSCDVHD